MTESRRSVILLALVAVAAVVLVWRVWALRWLFLLLVLGALFLLLALGALVGRQHRIEIPGPVLANLLEWIRR